MNDKKPPGIFTLFKVWLKAKFSGDVARLKYVTMIENPTI